jgi:metal-dependent amidase/aminoacylase/carboxypeptidase family protein
MNSSMFLPQAAGMYLYDYNGQQKDDINTIFEYVDQVILKHHDNTPEDEDGNNGHHIHMTRLFQYSFEVSFIQIQLHPVSPHNGFDYIDLKESLLTGSLEIVSPPPEPLSIGFSSPV